MSEGFGLALSLVGLGLIGAVSIARAVESVRHPGRRSAHVYAGVSGIVLGLILLALGLLSLG